MSLDTYYYDSLGTLLNAVEATPRQTDYSTMETTYQPCAVNRALAGDRQFYGRSLQRMVTDCRVMTPFTQQIARIEALAAQLRTTLPLPQSVKRLRQRRAQGDIPDVNRMLRGDLEHAWTTMERALRHDPSAFTTIIVPSGYSVDCTQPFITWSMAATLALAWLLEDSGRRTQIVDCMYFTPLVGVTPETNWSQVTILKAYDAPWSLQEAVVTTDRAWLRRLAMRLLEAHYPTIQMGHGLIPGPSELCRHFETCAGEYHWPHNVHGAHPNYDGVSSEAGAVMWLGRQLETLKELVV